MTRVISTENLAMNFSGDKAKAFAEKLVDELRREFGLAALKYDESIARAVGLAVWDILSSAKESINENIRDNEGDKGDFDYIEAQPEISFLIEEPDRPQEELPF